MGCLKLTYREEPPTLRVVKSIFFSEEKSSAGVYRYGYQGSEKDDEIKGTGNSYTTEYRMLDPRLGRWTSTDAKASSYPWQSPYTSMDNNPILLNDPFGLSTGDNDDSWKIIHNEDGSYNRTEHVDDMGGDELQFFVHAYEDGRSLNNAGTTNVLHTGNVQDKDFSVFGMKEFDKNGELYTRTIAANFVYDNPIPPNYNSKSGYIYNSNDFLSRRRKETSGGKIDFLELYSFQDEMSGTAGPMSYINWKARIEKIYGSGASAMFWGSTMTQYMDALAPSGNATMNARRGSSMLKSQSMSNANASLSISSMRSGNGSNIGTGSTAPILTKSNAWDVFRTNTKGTYNKVIYGNTEAASTARSADFVKFKADNNIAD